MTQFGVRPRMSDARRRIDAAGYAFQALSAARRKEAGKDAPKPKPLKTSAKRKASAAPAPANPPEGARAQWFWPCFQPGEAADIAEAGDSLSSILLAVSKHYDVSINDLKSARRHKRLVMPRHVFCYLAATVTRKSLPQIGAFLGDRDHTTVLHAVRKIKGLIKDGRLDPATLPTVR